jgi:hypothetical protein
MPKQAFSGKNIIFTLGNTPPFPIDLAKEDEALVVENTNDDFDDPIVDLSGIDGCHQENADGSGTITFKVAPTASASLKFLDTWRRTRQAISVAAGRDITTQGMAFIAKNVVLKKAPAWSAGAKRGNYEYVLSYISCDMHFDGPREIPAV